MNWRAMSKSPSFSSGDDGLQVVALLAGDPDLIALGLALDALEAELLDEPLSSRALSEEMPTVIVADLAHGAAGRLLDLAELEALQRHAPLHQLLLEHLAHGA